MSKDECWADPNVFGDEWPQQWEEDQGYGFCPECGTALVNSGAHSDGDGDLYDLIVCPCCEYYEKANEVFFTSDGQKYDDYDERNYYEQFLIHDDDETTFPDAANAAEDPK